MRPVAIALVGVVFAAAPIRADDASVAVIKKAIEAHGGADNLRKALSSRGKINTIAYRDGTPITAEVECVYRLPGCERVTITQATGDTNKVVRIVTKEQFHFKYGDQFIELSSDAQADKKKALQIYYICTLVPLLKDNGYTTSLVGERTVGSGNVTGVRVQNGSEFDVTLYFDSTSALLVRAVFQGYDGQKRAKQEYVYRSLNSVASGAASFQLLPGLVRWRHGRARVSPLSGPPPACRRTRSSGC